MGGWRLYGDGAESTVTFTSMALVVRYGRVGKIQAPRSASLIDTSSLTHRRRTSIPSSIILSTVPLKCTKSKKYLPEIRIVCIKKSLPSREPASNIKKQANLAHQVQRSTFVGRSLRTYSTVHYNLACQLPKRPTPFWCSAVQKGS